MPTFSGRIPRCFVPAINPPFFVHAIALLSAIGSVDAVASPLGTSYSVQHRLGGEVGPPGITCISNSAASGDNIVIFNAVAETISTHVLGGAIPVVSELHQYLPNGSRYIQINTASQAGNDLYPAGGTHMGFSLHDLCFNIGLDDPLTWQGVDTVSLARITFYKDGAPLLGPFTITNLFSDPWDGVLDVTLEGGVGVGIDAVQLEITLTKNAPIPAASAWTLLATALALAIAGTAIVRSRPLSLPP
jgi:hypothetical protein